MSKPMTSRCPDYQIFEICDDGIINPATIGPRMRQKIEAIPIPDIRGKKVLDVGCDYGFWSFMASNLGAEMVIGLDRCRPVRGQNFDLIKSNREVAEYYKSLNNCHFEHINLGLQWFEFGKFDVVFLFSLYHHIFENCGGHLAIWFWLWRHTAPGGCVIWENPVDVSDGVAHSNISKDKHRLYNLDAIMGAAQEYFDIQFIGPARHEPSRYVYKFTRKESPCCHVGKIEGGAGGAEKAFLYSGGRRSREIKNLLGFDPFPGSLNVRLENCFNFEKGYYVGEILDVKKRSEGFDSKWEERRCRFYPVDVNGKNAYAMRFEGEDYDHKFIELIAPYRIRDFIEGDHVAIERQ